MTASVAVAYIAGLAESLEQQGLLPEALTAAGVPIEVLEDPDNRIKFDQYVELWKSAVSLTGDSLLGLKTGSHFHPGNLGGLASILVAAPTLQAATQQLIRYEHILQDGLQTQMGEAAGKTYLEFSCNYPDDDVTAVMEKEVAEAVAVARFVLQRADVMDKARGEVWFKHKPLGDIAEYEELLGVTVKFSQPAYRLMFDPEVLQHNTSYGNEGVFNSVLKEIDQQSDQDLESQVKRLVAESIHQGVPEVKEVAEKFGMSHRTFQRRLADEGTRYKELVAEVRKSTAIDLLKRADCSIGEIAYLVGFTEASTFHQAFKRWTGQSPGEYRKSQQA